MGKPHKPQSGRTNLASCILASIFVIFLLIIASILYFTLFNPKNPAVAVNAVRLPAFSLNNSAVTFTFSQYATVRNPNRAVFSHYDSSLRLLHAGAQVGFMFIPAGKIAAGRTSYMAATFSVKSFPVSVGPAVPGDGLRVGPSMEIESTLEMVGRVRVLHFFTHHVEARADCRVSVSVGDGYTSKRSGPTSKGGGLTVSFLSSNGDYIIVSAPLDFEQRFLFSSLLTSYYKVL